MTEDNFNTKNNIKDLDKIDNLSTLPILPLRNSVFFPGAVMPITVGRNKTISLIEDAINSKGFVGIVTQKSHTVDDPNIKDIYSIGSIARIIKVSRSGKSGFNIVAEGLKRFKILNLVQEKPFFIANIQHLNDDDTNDVEIDALYLNLKGMAREVIDLLPEIPLMAKQLVDSISTPGHLADMMAANLDAAIKDKQQILEAINIKYRLNIVLKLLNKQREVLKLSNKIHTQVKGEMSRNHREYFLRQQLKAIKEELGDKEDDNNNLEEIEKKISDLDAPDDVKKVVTKEYKRLKNMQPHQAEYIVAKTYIDWILDLPWNKSSKDNLNIADANKQLDKDHYGLSSIKSRIIEFLAVRKMKDSIKSPILCFVGPPGVGKTSLGKSVAKAIGRNFCRVSLGGIRDEAEIRGHRRTYIGALPGRIIQGLKKAKTNNPVFLLDEIDKLGHDFRGDPSSALLEILDPEQNYAFSDHYLEVDFDLSKVFFICTANQIGNIPTPLRDRMEVIELSSYTFLEKLNIAKKYLIPKQIKNHGIINKNIRFTDQSICNIATDYTREAGVRNLEREIARICRNVVVQIIKSSENNIHLNDIVIKKSSLKKFLGPIKYHNESISHINLPGFATGLAWTSLGGEVLLIEATKITGKNQVILTGQLGNVMKESVQTALSWVKSQAANLKLSQKSYQNTDIHIHFPSAAIPKDGPSAGITIAMAIVSLFTEKCVRQNVAMTGEITLCGFVLPVGGIKEKVLAAHRNGMKTVILPYKNKQDLHDIPTYIKNKIKFVFVNTIEEVLKESIII